MRLPLSRAASLKAQIESACFVALIAAKSSLICSFTALRAEHFGRCFRNAGVMCIRLKRLHGCGSGLGTPKATAVAELLPSYLLPAPSLVRVPWLR
jgi:hypothetical protein